MKKIISSTIIFACAAVMLCGCKGKKDNDRLSNSYDVSAKASSSSNISNNSSAENTAVTSEIKKPSAVTKKTSDGKASNTPTDIYDEVRADGEAEDIDLPSGSSSAKSENSSVEKPTGDTSAGDASNDEKASKPSESSSSAPSKGQDSKDENSSKDSMSGWSLWR